LFVLLSVFEFIFGFVVSIIFNNEKFYSFVGNIYRVFEITFSFVLIIIFVQKLLSHNFFALLTFGKRNINLNKIIVWFFFGVLIYLISFLIANLCFGITLFISDDESRFKILFSSIIVQFFISAKEEYLYRCILLQVLDKTKISKYLVIVISAIVFTFLHIVGYTPIYLINIFITGIIWGFLVYKEKGIEVVFALHVSSNIMVSVFLYLFDFSNWQIGIIFNLLTLVLYFIYTNRKKANCIK
jgi:membrane protease YdiL (CAAX protease family)